MAQAPRAANGDDFVRHIVHDPKNVPDVMLLYGYLGTSSEEGHERLYLSPDLSAYVEVPNGSILHRAEAPREQDPHGGVTLWVKKDAAVKYRTAPAQEAAQKAMAWYFAGALQAGAAGAQAGMQALPQTLPAAFCPQTIGHTCLPRASCGCTAQRTPCPEVSCGCTAQRTPCPEVSCGIACSVACPTVPPQATCGCTAQRTPCPEVSCDIACSPNATCAPGCPTHHLTCAQVCTNAPLCVTRGQPDCPFPSEIPAQCTHAVNCRLPQAQAAMAAGAQVGIGGAAQIGCALGTIHQSLQIACSLATCAVECWVTRHVTCFTCNPECWITRYWTCNIECQLTHNPEVCPVASGAACPPPQSIACGSIGCGGGGPGGGPVEQAQFCIAGSVRPPQVTVFCTIGAGCQSLVCPSWQYSCGWGCPPRTPACPW